MNKFTMLATVAAVSLSASAFAADYKAVKEVKTEAVAVAADDASTSSDFYATLGAGYGQFRVKDAVSFKKNKPSFMIGFGKQFDNQVRADITLEGNTKVTSGTNSYQSMAVMANAYYHFDDMASVSPYVTAGLGYAKNKVTIAGTAYKKNHVVGQAGVGISSKMSDKIILDLGYRFAYAGKVKLATGVTVKPTAHKVLAAIRLPL